MRRRTGIGRLLLVGVVTALAALGPAAASADAVKFTFIGDSKAAAIEFSPAAKRLLARGHIVRRDLKVCRRLVAPSCTYQRVTPTTALQAIRNYGRTLGRVLVIDVGYNDSSATYKQQLEQVVRAAKARGVKGIVWVNLRVVPAHPDYRRINAIIAEAGRRRPILYVANWNAYTRGKPASWFGSDGIHLTGAGAMGLVRLVRRNVTRAAEGAADPASSQAATDVTGTMEDEPATTTADGATATVTATEEAALTGNSPPVGPNLGGSDSGSRGFGEFLVFAGGAALMLFLILVTVKRRGAA